MFEKRKEIRDLEKRLRSERTLKTDLREEGLEKEIKIDCQESEKRTITYLMLFHVTFYDSFIDLMHQEYLMNCTSFVFL